VLLCFLVFCVVVFGGVRVALFFSFLCCALCFVGLCSVSCVICYQCLWIAPSIFSDVYIQNYAL
jgi:hypothetical protein